MSPSGPPPRKRRARPPKAAEPEQSELPFEEPAPKPKPKKTPARKAPAKRVRSGPPTPVGNARPAMDPRLRIGLVAGAAAIAVMVLAFVSFAFMPGPGSGKQVELDWKPQTGSSEAASMLSAAGLVRSSWMFGLYAGLSGGVDEVDPGVHLLSDDMSPRTLLRRLRRLPGGATVKVAIPEGYNKFEIAKRMHESGVCASRALIAATTDKPLLQELRLGPADAEGYLFPATYEFQRNADPKEVVRRMVLESDRRYARLFDQYEAGFAELKNTLSFGRHEVITLASIIEKETGAEDERPLIASVFLNRLRDGNQKPERRKLQSDPTARYGCLVNKVATCESPDGKVTPAMIHDPANAYSTYAHAGLTPGPIANPSEKSVQAVLAPAQTKYMFFVAKGGGRHTFSESFDEHRDAVRGGRK